MEDNPYYIETDNLIFDKFDNTGCLHIHSSFWGRPTIPILARIISSEPEPAGFLEQMAVNVQFATSIPTV